MKRIYIALALIAASVITAVASHSVLERRIVSLTEGLYSLIDLSESAKPSELKKETEKFCLLWEKSSSAMHIFIIHSEMDNIEICITSLPDLLECDNLEEFRLSCIKAIGELKNLLDSEKLSLDNILFAGSTNLQFVHNIKKYHEMCYMYHDITIYCVPLVALAHHMDFSNENLLHFAPNML